MPFDATIHFLLLCMFLLSSNILSFLWGCYICTFLGPRLSMPQSMTSIATSSHLENPGTQPSEISTLLSSPFVGPQKNLSTLATWSLQCSGISLHCCTHVQSTMSSFFTAVQAFATSFNDLWIRSLPVHSCCVLCVCLPLTLPFSIFCQTQLSTVLHKLLWHCLVHYLTSAPLSQYLSTTPTPHVKPARIPPLLSPP